MDGSDAAKDQAAYWAEVELVRRRNELEKIEQDKQRVKLLKEEVLTKRGRNLLVFHCGGSKYLKFGRASEERPFVFEHVCAYQSTARHRGGTKKGKEQAQERRGKRTFREVYVGDNEKAFRASLEKETTTTTTTTVKDEHDHEKKKKKKMRKSQNENDADDDGDGDDDDDETLGAVEVKRTKEEEEKEKETKDFGRKLHSPRHRLVDWKFGKEALETYEESDDDWELVFPFRKGKLVASETVLENCWRDALEKAGFSSKRIREKMDVLLIASPLCSREDVETMARTLLVGLNFRSICVHGESTCAYFSLGSRNQKVTCVVDIGAQKITAECVDSSGCPIPNSLVALPYGYEHMSLCNVAANRSCGTWMEKLNGGIGAYEWFENVLAFSRDTITCDNDVRYEDRVVRFKHSGKLYESSSCSKALAFASDALFEPERIKFKGPFTGAGGVWDDEKVGIDEDEDNGGGGGRGGRGGDDEDDNREKDDEDDDYNDAERKGSIATSIGTFILPSALSREEDSLVNKSNREEEEEEEKEEEEEEKEKRRKKEDGEKKESMRKSRPDREVVGLHEAIVASCLSCELPMQKCEALQNILLVGGGAEIPEIEEVIEGRISSTLSFIISSMEDEELATHLRSITPIVLDHRAGTVYSEATWSGGCILGCLDDSRGNKEWLSQDVFQNRLKVGDASKIESWVGGNGGYELNGLFRYYSSSFSSY
jgi:actin-related protein